MKIKIKKFVYLLNDVTNLILRKNKVEQEGNAKKLRNALIIVSIILVLSLALNFYLYFY